MKPIVQEKDKETSPLHRSSLLQLIPKNMFQPNAPLYYVDFTLSVACYHVLIALACYVINDMWEMPSIIVYLGVFVVVLLSSFAQLRSLLFVHEALHQHQTLPYFKYYYNVMFGFANRLPFYSYEPHLDHHNPEKYGTIQDPEYETVADSPLIINFVLAPFVLLFFGAVFVTLRFTLVPFLLPFIGESGRNLVYRFISTLVMNMKYDRGQPNKLNQRRDWYLQDLGCAFFTIVYIILYHYQLVSINYFLISFISQFLTFSLNHFRALIAHRYYSERNPSSRKEMILDSVNYTNIDSWLVWLVFPVGLQYHSLHHLFPNIPYHHLAAVHEILMKKIDNDHPYRYCNEESYWQSIRKQYHFKL